MVQEVVCQRIRVEELVKPHGISSYKSATKSRGIYIVWVTLLGLRDSEITNISANEQHARAVLHSSIVPHIQTRSVQDRISIIGIHGCQ